MGEENKYKWTDNPTVSGVSKCDTDILNDCLMHLKYEKSSGLRNIGEIITSTIPLNDAGLHLLDGALIQNGVYSAFIDNMAKLFVTNPKLFCTQEEYDQSIADYGVCGKYVYDSEANTVRLPKTTERKLIAKSEDNLLPSWLEIYSDGYVRQGGQVNVSANANSFTTIDLLVSFRDTNYTVELSSIGNDNTNGYQPNSAFGLWYRPLSANQIYLSGAGYNYFPVRTKWVAEGYGILPEGLNNHLFEYIVLATTTKTDIEVNIDNIVTDLNSKADINGSNINYPRIIKSWTDDAYAGYYIRSDGYCKQWGAMKCTYAGTWINLFVPYKSAAYNVIGSNASHSVGNIEVSTGGSTAAAQNSSAFVLISLGNQFCMWTSCGYVNLEEVL